MYRGKQLITWWMIPSNASVFHLFQCIIWIICYDFFVKKMEKNLNIRKNLRILWCGNVHVSRAQPIFDGWRDEKNFQVGIFDWNKIMNDGWMNDRCVKWMPIPKHVCSSVVFYSRIWSDWCANSIHVACNGMDCANEIQHHLEMYLSY